MGAKYWGELPAPNIVRGNSLNTRGNAERGKGDYDLPIDTNMAGAGPSGPVYRAEPRQDRYSTQTDKTEATMSTMSPFVSPIASEFRGDGLAPRPSSFQAGASDAPYDKDFSEKRRRRESRNRNSYGTSSSRPQPPSADPSRAPPPTSYKEPNGYTQSSNQAPARSRSTRRSDGPISPGTGRSEEEYYRAAPGQEYQQGDEEKFQTRRLVGDSGRF